MPDRSIALPLALSCLIAGPLAAAEPRPLKVDDVLAIREVADPRLSPDGRWVAYTVTTPDVKEDQSDADIYMAPFAGGPAVRLTASKKSETSPRFSPDGRSLAFLSSREGKKTQVWLLNREGGDPVKLTDFKSSVSSLAWSPDGTRLALVVSDVDPDDPDGDGEDAGSKPKTRKPIVIRRLQFKRDGEGYLREVRNHIHVFDVQKKTSFQLTSGAFDDSQPAWSPDGKWIAFSSNRTSDPDANQNSDIFLVAARQGEVPRALTTTESSDRSPVFSPDGRWVAYLQGGDPGDIWYAPHHLALVPVTGGPPTALTAALDRDVSSPRFSPDGKWVLFLLEDGGNSHLARVAVAGGAVERIVVGERDVIGYDVSPSGAIAVLESRPQAPPEISAVTGGELRRITTVNDELLSGIKLGRVERFKAKSADGTMIDGFLTYPPDAPQGRKLPAILRIHGGPVSQFSTRFSLEWQLLAAHGYAVIAANPRGSSGYGRAFSRAIWADWGNKDFEDVMAAVDHVIAMGVADPDRLGVGGWSYGGILTDNVITKTGRFKAAISGASESNYLANYGTDHYQYVWEKELGLPWRNTELWVKLSPWFAVDKITTPTLLMGGSDDMNVPLLNSEQLYQALRRLGRETELVIYPGQNHGIRKPSYVKDRYERYLAWYDRFLKPETATSSAAPPEARSLLGAELRPPELTPERRRALEANLAKATADFVKDPDSADAIIWLGRRTAYLGRFREAVDVFTRGIAKHPDDIRLYRHRGHRYITLRQLDQAVADLQKAAQLIETRHIPDEVEPDGDPNAQNVPTSTSHFNIYYHLGLAHYLKGDFEKALAAYRECLKYSTKSDDRLVATSDWLYMTLRRLGREREAAEVLRPISKDLKVVDNHAYWNRLLMYKGEKTPEDLLGPQEDPVQLATYGYGVGNWYLYNGQREKAREVFERIVRGPGWPAFGFIAAEAELARTPGSAASRP
jgi:dipeptidyl aminopeptidase/acylaminoacyl peptidase/tetratricopeptide (TPR) repeat protein